MGQVKISRGIKHLESMRHIQNMIHQLNQQLMVERARLMDVSVHYKEVNVMTSGAGDKMYEKMPEIVELEETVKNYITDLARKKQITLELLRYMKPKHQEIILMYYLNHYTYEMIEEELDRSHDYVWRTLKAAKDEFGKLFENSL